MDKSIKLTVLSQVPLFRDLNEEELTYVEGISIQRFFKKKSIVFSEGSEKEAVFFIHDGLVKAFKTDENGHEQIVSFLKTGDMFPHIGFFNQDPYPATAETIVDTHLLAIPLHKFEQLLLNTPTIAIKVMRVLGAKIKELQEKLQEFSGQDVNHRSLSFLLKLAERHGVPRGDAIIIDLPITHQEFANAIGTSRETINRLLTQLRKENILHTDRNKITITDMDALRQWNGAH